MILLTNPSEKLADCPRLDHNLEKREESPYVRQLLQKTPDQAMRPQAARRIDRALREAAVLFQRAGRPRPHAPASEPQ